jgi:SNF2 family DNA or RNA helicase
MLNVGVYGIERDDGDEPVPISKRIGRVEKILSMRKKLGDVPAIFCVKEHGKSYRDVANVNENVLLKHCPQLIRNFLKRLSQLGREDGHCLDRADSPAFDPLFTRIDRIIAHDIVKKRKIFLVKWCRLSYTEATWEKEEDLTRDRSAVSRYHQINRRVPHIVSVGKSIQKVFKDGRALRDYQEAGVTWLDHNFENRTNCVLADEMGLGKTIQVSFPER